jgi:hypothetical protein
MEIIEVFPEDHQIREIIVYSCDINIEELTKANPYPTDRRSWHSVNDLSNYNLTDPRFRGYGCLQYYLNLIQNRLYKQNIQIKQ